MEITPNLNLPYIMPAQAQKHVTHNEAIRMLDVLIQLSAISASLPSPPSTPLNGERYIVPPNPESDWAGQSANIATFQDNSWAFLTPQTGWQCWVEETQQIMIFDGDNWITQASSDNSDNAEYDRIGINTGIDPQNRLSVKSNNILFSHDETKPSGDARININKQTKSDIASIHFQTDYNSHAEIGLNGDNSLSIKTSTDGLNWLEPIKFTSSGEIDLQSSIKNELAIVGANPLLQLRDRAGGIQANITAQFNPDWQDGNGRDWGGVGIMFQEIDETADPITEIGPKVGIGWSGRQAKEPYFVNNDGHRSQIMTQDSPILPSYSLDTLPSPSSQNEAALAYVTNAIEGSAVIFCDGSNWRRVSDLTLVD